MSDIVIRFNTREVTAKYFEKLHHRLPEIVTVCLSRDPGIEEFEASHVGIDLRPYHSLAEHSCDIQIYVHAMTTTSLHRRAREVTTAREIAHHLRENNIIPPEIQGTHRVRIEVELSDSSFVYV